MDTTKIIKGVVNSGRYTVTAPIMQEHYGIILKIEGAELPETYQVDFSNDEHYGTSVTMIGNADGVLIPRQFIDTGKDVFAFLYWVGEDYGKTVYKFRIPNKLRPDRTEETPTPEEQSVIDQCISALNEAVEQTAQDVIDASASAQSAQGYAEQAESARDTAQTYANNAQTSANNASASASQASASASASAQSASEAQSASTNAETYALNSGNKAVESAQSASASANSATTAQGYATSASQSATSAQGYASQAQTSANTASAKAQDASTSAQTASTKATEASQSATNASASATQASGYATSAQTAQGLAESARDSAQGYAEDAQGYANDAQASAESISASASQIAQNTADILKAFPTDTASGAVASFPDGADDIPLKSLVVDINPVQSGSGDPSPDNVRPISGWTGANITATNTNLRGGIDLANDIKARISSAVINTTEKTVSWGYNATHNEVVYAPKVSFKKNTRYTFIITAQNASKRLNFRIYYTDGSIQALPDLTTTRKETLVIVTSANKTVLTIVRQAQGGTTKIYYDESGIFEGVLTADDFEPFGQVIPINWQTEAGTVYGGKLDVLTGILTVYPYYASYNGETLTGEWISDRDVYAVGTTPTIGAQVVNIGAQGTEYQLEAHDVASLLGQNNIWADATGDCSVEYRANTKLYIEKLTQPEEDMIADSNIVSGQYFMVGNSLFKATANIANGGQIIVGTNATRVSLAQALNEINA